MKEQEEEEHTFFFFFLPDSVGFHNVPHNITFNSSLIPLKLAVGPAKFAQQNAVSFCMSRGLHTVLNKKKNPMKNFMAMQERARNCHF